MKALDLRQRSIGTWCQIGHPANAEIMAQAGFDWLAADCEHGVFEDGDLSGFCRAVRRFARVPLVRVQENAVMPIRRALDLGAAGVIVPLVDTAAAAEAAVRAAHYPPRGIRGFAWHHGNAWGADFTAYVKEFEPIVAVMIESRTAVENIDAIMAVDGVDAGFVGHYDLSGSYGIAGQIGHRLIQDACATVAAACRRQGKAAGQLIVTPTTENVRLATDMGFSFLGLGMDSFFLGNGTRQALALLA